MADARALLRARRQDVRVAHPHAVYTAAGQLRCMACGAPVKSAAAWEGHVGSKAHRVAVAEMRRREENEQEEGRRKRRGKRKAEETDEKMDVDADLETNLIANTKKRRLSGERNSTRPPTKSSSGFPTDFFSAPSLAPILNAPDDIDDIEQAHSPASELPHVKTDVKSQIDLEWAQFQASLLSPNTISTEKEETEEVHREAFERATVFAEPELTSSSAQGFPPDVVAEEREELQSGERKEGTEDLNRRRKEQEERELIMDRMVEEERAQEEADERVGMLKARVEALKRAREVKKAGKGAKDKA
ncbi:hypothetical protein EW145_g5677 [Phellinidium pouzarii]|uniref:Uncharacterized protein n=1 Tax=Phellinidium pouzarii TaxID=167371 RepID=A0A4S4L119_9AGAM|nr:hypothetical protein EW145_g5677 [Phellinidium pouzarii]